MNRRKRISLLVVLCLILYVTWFKSRPALTETLTDGERHVLDHVTHQRLYSKEHLFIRCSITWFCSTGGHETKQLLFLCQKPRTFHSGVTKHCRKLPVSQRSVCTEFHHLAVYWSSHTWVKSKIPRPGRGTHKFNIILSQQTLLFRRTFIVNMIIVSFY